MVSGTFIWDALLNGFVDQSVLSGRKDLARRRRAVVSDFMDSLRIASPAEITAPLIRSYLASRMLEGKSGKTASNYLAVLSTWCEYLKEAGAMGENPCVHVEQPAHDETPPRFLDDDEIGLALKVADENGIGVEVRLALLSGLRMTELRMLKWSDVLWKPRLLLVGKSKNRRFRHVPLCQDAIDVILSQQQLTGTFQFVFPGRCRSGATGMRGHEWWTEALKPLQDAIPKFRELPGRCTGRGWHLLRHTWFTRLAESGASLARVSMWGGHADVNFTRRRYAHLQEAYHCDIERLCGAVPVTPPPPVTPNLK